MHFTPTGIVSFIVVLGIMVFIHELGHFIVAKLCGVRVERFSLGFPPRLIGFKRGDTDYCIGAIPLGGFVKMAGENPMEATSDDPGEFMNHPRWQRFAIALAGPAMNILLAVALLTGVFMIHFEYPAFMTQKAQISSVEPNSAAAKAGILAGDTIIRIDDVQNPTWEDVRLKVGLSPNHPVSLAVDRNGQILSLSVTPVASGPDESGEAGWYPQSAVMVGRLEKDMPLAQAGVQVGDVISALNGQPMYSVEQLTTWIKNNGDKPIAVTYIRNGQSNTVKVVPKISNTDGNANYPRLGFAPDYASTVERLPFFKALGKSIEQNKKYSVLIIEVVRKLFTRQLSLRQVEGPLSIARDVGVAVQMEGWMPLLGLMAAISLNLGIFNLLPIPIMDGGVIMLLLIEGAMRRDISLRLKERIYQVAFVFLVIFAVMVIYNDVMKTFFRSQ